MLIQILCPGIERFNFWLLFLYDILSKNSFPVLVFPETKDEERNVAHKGNGENARHVHKGGILRAAPQNPRFIGTIFSFLYSMYVFCVLYQNFFIPKSIGNEIEVMSKYLLIILGWFIIEKK